MLPAGSRRAQKMLVMRSFIEPEKRRSGPGDVLIKHIRNSRYQHFIPLSLSNQPNFDAGNSYWNFSSHRYVNREVTICFY